MAARFGCNTSEKRITLNCGDAGLVDPGHALGRVTREHVSAEPLLPRLLNGTPLKSATCERGGRYHDITAATRDEHRTGSHGQSDAGQHRGVLARGAQSRH